MGDHRLPVEPAFGCIFTQNARIQTPSNPRRRALVTITYTFNLSQTEAFLNGRLILSGIDWTSP
jgi:hypothetical protein